MNELLLTRAGGDRDEHAVAHGSAIDTAGAPAFKAAQFTKLAMVGEGLAPEWIELIPAGVFRGRDGRGPYRLADPAAVICATRELRMEAGIPIDYDHASEFAAPAGNPAPAAGWIIELAAREGAIWGRVEWTPRAAQAIRSREYRYISPVFQYSPDSGEVTRLLRAGLTNNPNLFLTAISSADEAITVEEFLKQLRAMLQLADDASLDDILLAVGAALRDSGMEPHEGTEAAARSAAGAAVPDPARYVAIAQFEKALTELNSLRAERAHEHAERQVEDAMRAGKLVPAQREWAISYCSADPRGFAAFAARQPALLAGETSLGEVPARATGASRTPLALSSAESAICSQLGIPAGDFIDRKNSGVDFLKLNKDRELGR